MAKYNLKEVIHKKCSEIQQESKAVIERTETIRMKRKMGNRTVKFDKEKVEVVNELGKKALKEKLTKSEQQQMIRKMGDIQEALDRLEKKL